MKKWFRVKLILRSWSCPFAPDQRVEAPVATAPRRHVQKDETEQDGRDALVLKGPPTIWRMKLPVCDRHHAGQNKCYRSREETEHDRDTAKELEYPTDTDLGH